MMIVGYEGPFHSENLYLKDIMPNDMTDIQISMLTERYYIVTPWKYIIQRYVKFVFLFLLLSAFAFKLFFLGLVPVGMIIISQFYNFVKHLENMNVSPKKLIVSMWCIIGIEMAVCALIRYELLGIIFF